MKLIKVKERASESLVFSSILSAISIILFTILTFVPFSFIIISFLFPIIAAVQGYFCKKRYFGYYLLTTILFCSLINFDISNLLFYLLPALLLGFIGTQLIKKEINLSTQVFICSIVHFLITLITIPIIEQVYSINIVTTLLRMFGLENTANLEYFVVPVIYILSFFQTFITYIFMVFYLKNYNVPFYVKTKKDRITGILISVFSLISIFLGVANLFPPLILLFFLFSFLLSIFSFSTINYKKNYFLLFSLIFVIISIIIYVSLFKMVKTPNQISLFSSFGIFYGVYYSIIKNIYYS